MNDFICDLPVNMIYKVKAHTPEIFLKSQRSYQKLFSKKIMCNESRRWILIDMTV